MIDLLVRSCSAGVERRKRRTFVTGFAQRLQPNGSIREGERRHRRQHACRRQAAPWVSVLATRKHLLSSDWNGTLRFHSFWGPCFHWVLQYAAELCLSVFCLVNYKCLISSYLKLLPVSVQTIELMALCNSTGIQEVSSCNKVMGLV